MKQIVYTETSKYEIDELARTLTRFPGEGLGEDPSRLPGGSVPINKLRGDKQVLHLIEIRLLEVGKVAVFKIRLPNGDRTVRITTVVRGIEERDD